MRFLFIKDIYTTRYKFSLLGLVWVGLLLVCYVLDRMWMLTSLFGLNLFTVIISVQFLYDRDKKVDWKVYQRALPIKKTDMVKEKYILMLIIAIIMISVNIFVLFITKDRWYTGGEAELNDFVSQNVLYLFMFPSLLFIILMIELISGTKDSKIIHTVVGIAVFLGISMGSFFIIGTNVYSNFLEDIWAMVIWGSLIFVLTTIITYILSLFYVKKGWDIL